jgi:hypothetical protein
MTNTHGGARPKVREDDGRIHNRPTVNPGRRPNSMTLKVGQKLFVVTTDQNGNHIDQSQLWTIAEMDRSWLTIHSDNGDTIRIRR